VPQVLADVHAAPQLRAMLPSSGDRERRWRSESTCGRSVGQCAEGVDRTRLAPRDLPQRGAVSSQLGKWTTHLCSPRPATIQSPVGPERLHDFVEVVGQAKNTARRQEGATLLEVLQNRSRPGHLEAQHHRRQRSEITWFKVEVGLYDVPVEGHVQRLAL